MPDTNRKMYGQFFTPEKIVNKMLSLIKNKGRVLEPSAGDGAFYKKIDGCVGIEIDEKYCNDGCINIDFFDYNIIDKFDTIIGNPPYVKCSEISEDTKNKVTTTLFDDRTNLYQYFIERSFCLLENNGEIIFITPREFLHATSNIKLNKLLYDNGTFTHYFDMGDSKVFTDAHPNCCIWRYEKNNFDRSSITNDGIKKCSFVNGQIVFCSKKYEVNFSDIFDVSVGGVSGADKIFTHEDGNMDFVCSYTKTTGETKRMIYNIDHPHLLPYRNKLKNRKIKKFNDDTWYMWGRDFNKSNKKRVYVNNKTREENPFFTHKCRNYDGSVLALFIEDSINDEEELVEMLNKVDWKELGFVCGNRFMFNQKSLQNTVLPISFNKFIKYKKRKAKKKKTVLDSLVKEACVNAIEELIKTNKLFDHIDIITFTRNLLKRNTDRKENQIIEYIISKNISKYLPEDYDKVIINTSMACSGPICQYIYFPHSLSCDTYIRKGKQYKHNLYGLTKENRVQIPLEFIRELGDVENIIIDDETNFTYILALGEKKQHLSENISILKVNKDVRISSTLIKEKYGFLPNKLSIIKDDGVIKISPQILS